MIRTAICVSLILALAACSGPTGPETRNEATVEPARSDNAIVAAADNDTGTVTPAAPTPTPSATPATPATPATATPRTFPAAFRGRWGMNTNDCNPRRDDNKGLVTISADAIRFYESRGTIVTLTISSPTRIAADLSFSGEGQNWQSRTVFDLSAGGSKLARTEEEPAGSYVYAKCG